MKEDRVAFLLLFCGMILVKNDKATIAESLSILPLNGSALQLAGELSTPATR
jgi:hypothetical protein